MKYLSKKETIDLSRIHQLTTMFIFMTLLSILGGKDKKLTDT